MCAGEARGGGGRRGGDSGGGGARGTRCVGWAYFSRPMLEGGRAPLCSGWEVPAEGVAHDDPPEADLAGDTAQVAAEFGKKPFALHCVGVSWYAPRGAGGGGGGDSGGGGGGDSSAAAAATSRAPGGAVRASELPLCEGWLVAWSDAGRRADGEAVAQRRRVAAYEQRERELQRARRLLVEAQARHNRAGAAHGGLDEANRRLADAAVERGRKQLEEEGRRLSEQLARARAAVAAYPEFARARAARPDAVERYVRSSHRLYAQLRANATAAYSMLAPRTDAGAGVWGDAGARGGGGHVVRQRAPRGDGGPPDFLDLWQKAAVKLAAQMQRNAAALARAAGIDGGGGGGGGGGRPSGGGGGSFGKPGDM